MRRLQTALIIALGLLSFSERHADAQVTADARVTADAQVTADARLTTDPASPRWGDSVTITAEPNGAAPQRQCFDRSDHLYAVLGTSQQGTASPFGRPWAR
jgi:hypothetical protein